MKYSWKDHKDTNRHKNRIKRSGEAWFGVKRNIATTWRQACWETHTCIHTHIYTYAPTNTHAHTHTWTLYIKPKSAIAYKWLPPPVLLFYLTEQSRPPCEVTTSRLPVWPDLSAALTCCLIILKVSQLMEGSMWCTYAQTRTCIHMSAYTHTHTPAWKHTKIICRPHIFRKFWQKPLNWILKFFTKGDNEHVPVKGKDWM